MLELIIDAVFVGEVRDILDSLAYAAFVFEKWLIKGYYQGLRNLAGNLAD